jgi:type III pantothenate kinase
MLLTIDIGNTQIAAGLFEENELKIQWRLSSTRERTEDETWVLLQDICSANNYNVKKTTGVAISSVVPDMNSTFFKLSTKYLKLEPLFITHDLDLGIDIIYDTPASVGADRLCNAVAGQAKYADPLIIVDFGTATTFDVIARQGKYLGGVIAPGLELSSALLHERAAKLPRVSLSFPQTVIGHSTEHSIQSGLMYGTREMVTGIIRCINQELTEEARVIATGGLSRLMVEQILSLNTVEPFLTLEGLNIIYNRVRT